MMAVIQGRTQITFGSCVGIGKSPLLYTLHAGKSMTAVQIKAIYCHEDPSAIMVCFPVERGG